jgi:hypothetical protein
MGTGDRDALRSRAERAYARWRACEAGQLRIGAADAECTRLRREYELADRAYQQARRA